jgi:tRNA dimethylallyltransferase
VSHWGLNLIEPGEPYSAYKFKNYAEDVMADIKNRGKLSILVGGTGLYIDSLIFDFGFAGPANPIERYRLEGLPSQKLRAIIEQKDYPMPKNSQNRRHLIRVIERRGQVVSNKKLRNDVALVGIRFSEEELKQRISLRAARIFNEGVVEETRELIRHHGKHAIWTTGGIVYKICMRLLEGELTEEQALESFVKADWQYAKRQKTWFGRNKFIQWFKTPEEAFTSVKQVLNK